MLIYLIIYLLIMNALGFLLMRLDKKKARQRAHRIPERVLLGVAIIGGSIGSFIAMHLYHHKTRHRSFKYGIPAIMFVQMNIALLVFCS